MAQHATRRNYKIVSQMVDHGYDLVKHEVREELPTLLTAEITSSLTTRGTHAPALDVDVPAEIVKTVEGYTLWVDTKMSRWRYARLLKALHKAGLTTGQLAVGVGYTLKERQQYWAIDQPRVVDDSAYHERLAALKLGHEQLRSIEEAMVAARMPSPVSSEGEKRTAPWGVRNEVTRAAWRRIQALKGVKVLAGGDEQVDTTSTESTEENLVVDGRPVTHDLLKEIYTGTSSSLRETILKEGVTEGRPMTNPWAIPLHVEADLIPSTSNKHLYLATEMPWETYLMVLKALAKANVIERGYLVASKERQATHLRLPWVKKK